MTSDTNPKQPEPEPAAAPVPATNGRAAGRATAAILTIVAATLYSYVSLYRHVHFASNAFDLAVQDQTVWGYSQLEFIYNTVLGIPNLLGDHFHPILMVLAPFMWLWDSAGVLLVAQAVLLAVAAIPIYLWGERELGVVAGLAFMIAYLCFWGVLAGVIYDFHHVAFAVPAMSLALYATLTRRNLLLVPALVVAMLTREDVALTVIALGVYIALIQRRWILGATIAVVNAAWFAALLGFVIPSLGGGVAYRHWTYDALGSGPLSALANVVRHPIDSMKLLFTPAEKARVWAGSFLAFVLLPLASPLLIVALPSFLERFWSSSANFWSFHYQYSMLPAPILTFAAMDVCARLRRMLAGRWGSLSQRVLPIAAAAASVVLTFGFIRPLAEFTTYPSAARAAEIQSCLDTIPAAAGVTASNALVPHLSHRAQIYVISLQPSADYVAVDPATYGNFYAGEEDQLRQVVRGDLAAGYGIVCAKGTTLVLAHVESRVQLTPELQAWLAGRCSGKACARD